MDSLLDSYICVATSSKITPKRRYIELIPEGGGRGYCPRPGPGKVDNAPLTVTIERDAVKNNNNIFLLIEDANIG